MYEILAGFMVTAVLLWCLNALSHQHEAKRKRQYAKFLSDDRHTSTLEYVENVTRERRDSRVWR